jgi:hypothetical protein
MKPTRSPYSHHCMLDYTAIDGLEEYQFMKNRRVCEQEYASLGRKHSDDNVGLLKLLQT